MQQRQPTDHNQSGFSVIEISLVLLVVAMLAATGFVVYQHQKSTSAKNSGAKSTTQTATQPMSSGPSKPAYSNWLVYSNNVYGFSYSYPNDWTTSGEGAYDPKTSATRQEFGTGLRLRPTTQSSVTVDGEPVPSDTVAFEVLDEPLQTAAAWYDQYYAQSTIKVNKTTDNLMGRQSVQYDFVAPTYDSKRYLFAVGSKTYMFSSVNESLNTGASASYWLDFDNVFTSLTIQNRT